MNKRIIRLSNDWTAEFMNNGEFRMSCEGWGMVLYSPTECCIRHFANEIVLVNDDDGSQARTCLAVSSDGAHGYLQTSLNAAWVIDFEGCMFSPHRAYIQHHHDDQYVSAYEQPAYRRAQEYVTVAGKTIYVTFPFCTDSNFPVIWAEYSEIRKRQLDATYFGA